MRLAAAAAVSFSPLEDPLDLDALGTDFVDDLVRDIASSIAEIPRTGPAQTMDFSAETPAKARTAAGEWLRDFDAHEPLEIESIRTTPRGDHFVAVVTYRCTTAVAACASERNDTEADVGSETSPAQPAMHSEKMAAPDLPGVDLVTFDKPVVSKLPPVTPLRLGGENSRDRHVA